MFSESLLEQGDHAMNICHLIPAAQATAGLHITAATDEDRDRAFREDSPGGGDRMEIRVGSTVCGTADCQEDRLPHWHPNSDLVRGPDPHELTPVPREYDVPQMLGLRRETLGSDGRRRVFGARRHSCRDCVGSMLDRRPDGRPQDRGRLATRGI